MILAEVELIKTNISLTNVNTLCRHIIETSVYSQGDLGVPWLAAWLSVWQHLPWCQQPRSKLIDNKNDSREIPSICVKKLILCYLWCFMIRRQKTEQYLYLNFYTINWNLYILSHDQTTGLMIYPMVLLVIGKGHRSAAGGETLNHVKSFYSD